MLQTGNRSGWSIIYRSREYRCSYFRIVLLFCKYTYIPLGSLSLLFPSKSSTRCSKLSIFQISNSYCRYRFRFRTHIEVINHHVVILRCILIEDNIFAISCIGRHIYYKVFSGLRFFTTNSSYFRYFSELIGLVNIRRAADNTDFQYTVV